MHAIWGLESYAYGSRVAAWRIIGNSQVLPFPASNPLTPRPRPRPPCAHLNLQDLAQKKETMTHLQIPGLVQTFVMLPAVRRDERTVVHAYRELAEGERIQEEGQRKTMHMFCVVS